MSFGTAPTPHVEPACPKEPYYDFPVTTSGTHQSFYLPSGGDYTMACDVVVPVNGVYYLADSAYTLDKPSNNLIFFDYLNTGDYVDVCASPSPESAKRSREFYTTIKSSGPNQQISNPWLEDYADITSLNVAVNGIVLVPSVDFTYANQTITIPTYLSEGDWVMVLPSVMLNFAGTVPAINFVATFTASNQSFTNSLLTSYTSAADMIVNLNGLQLRPTINYTLANDTITVLDYISVGDNLFVFANTASC